MRNVTLLTIFAFLTSAVPAEAAELDFNRDVRPILSDNCFKCHGPDEEAREAELRLDTAAGLFEDRGGYSAIVPGKVDESEVLARVTTTDADLRMPPVDSNKKLTSAEIETIRQWIEQGAPWERHWAFVAPTRPPTPDVKRAAWPRRPLDHFVLAELERRGLEPSPAAESYALVRRVYLDLIGLPPSPEEADVWVERLVEAAREDGNDQRAWSELVNQLLASEHFGERWARRWLDLARYADTNGYEKDRERSIWPYRDWVIDAINRDMPFDQFTVEQLAGDMLPDASIDQHVATGFHRNTMLNEEGGIDPLEFRFHAMTDRVATTGTTWLGLTTGCAQCHTHKYDPITHREYYQLMAFLNNADEPDLDIPDAERAAQQQRNLAEADRLLAELPEHWPVENREDRESVIDQRFQDWLAAKRRETVQWRPLEPQRAESNLPLLQIQDDASIYASGDSTKHDIYRVWFAVPPGPPITAVRLEAMPDPRLPAHGPGMTFYEGTKGDFFLGEFQLAFEGQELAFDAPTHSYAQNRFGSNPVSAALATDGDLQTGWSVHGRLGERHVGVFPLAEPLTASGSLQLTMHFGRHYSSSLGRFRISVTSDRGAVARDLPREIESLLTLNDEQLSAEQRQQLRDEFLLNAEELRESAERIRELRKPLPAVTTLTMRERPAENPRPTYLHHRGEFLQPQEQVEPGTLAALHSLPADVPKNRLGLARWLVSQDNPLTARVTVNRLWSALFGTGIVKTSDDFGFQGDAPSHPDLLDWLAVEFVESGWSRKEILRQIVTSATYRQSSRVTAEALRADPENRWLGRAPRFRLEAEVLRDSILSSAGLLVFQPGGPPVRPPQPAGVTEAAYGSPTWTASEGADRYRRSVYTFLKRTAPFAMFQTFDAPSGEACVARRDVSNTALQALTLLNDLMFQEAAQALGDEIAAQDGDENERVRAVFRRVLTRPPTDGEVTLLVEFVRRQRESNPEGDESYVWTAVARALFGLDEAITRN